MLNRLFAFTFFCLTISFSIAQILHTDLPIDKTISENEKIEINTNENLSRIIINLQNVVDAESEVYWTAYSGKLEKPENEIGPKKYRTITLAPQKKGSESVRLDKKEIVLDTNNTDKIVIQVEKGEVNIQIKPSKKRM